MADETYENGLFREAARIYYAGIIALEPIVRSPVSEEIVEEVFSIIKEIDIKKIQAFE